MPIVHSSACVATRAEIADDAEIGPFCVVGPGVSIGQGCRLLAHVHVTGNTSIGARTIVYPFASLGTPPQSVRYRGGATRLVIGADCDIREAVTMNIGTEDGGGLTEVGDHGMYMVGAHVGHDCRVGRHVVFANSATLGGHCTCGDYAFIGGLSAAHQYTRIGAYAMIGGMTGLRGDVIPFGLAMGATARLAGLNFVGMKRRAFSRETRHAVRKAYNLLFYGDGLFAGRVDRVAGELGGDAAVAQIVEFIRAGHHRALCQPGEHHQD
jgi:UDP-N-acetylglucosamine acyltransferase